VEELTPLEAQKRQLSTDDGLYVTSVARGSVAAKSGLRVGDVIVMLGRYRVAKLKDLSTLLPRMPSSGRVRISVVRGDQVLSGALEFGEMEQD
jgi:S1-C subfamily serine protease